MSSQSHLLRETFIWDTNINFLKRHSTEVLAIYHSIMMEITVQITLEMSEG